MHDRYLRRAEESDRPWLLVEGPLDVRLEAAAGAVERILTTSG
jgi:hypothetical protein